MFSFCLQVACGMAHVLALSDVGDLYSWGANSYGQLGVGTTLNTAIPTAIQFAEERLVLALMQTYFVALG